MPVITGNRAFLDCFKKDDKNGNWLVCTSGNIYGKLYLCMLKACDINMYTSLYFLLLVFYYVQPVAFGVDMALYSGIVFQLFLGNYLDTV